jgi:hypothetical protein
MSTSAVSSSSINQQLQQYFQTRQMDLQQLGKALGSGDLAGAQKEFNSIVSLGQSGPFSGGQPFLKTQREQDFTALGQALQTGGLAGAQQAFQTLESTFKRGVAQDPPSATPASGIGPDVILNLSGNSSSTTGAAANSATSGGAGIVINLSENGGSTSPEPITINISNPASGGGEQVSLSVGGQGPNSQQIMFNLSPDSNQQIVVNLLGAYSSGSASGSSTSGSSVSGSSTSGSSVSGGGLSVSA